MEKNKLLIISGATATGKTGLSIDISKKYGKHFEVVNFDSLLFYKELVIGTAKPTSAEMAEVKHHLVSMNSICDEVNANDFVKMAEDKINELHQDGKIPILVGGSTFYLRSLIKGMYESTTPSPILKEEIDKLYKQEGITPFWNFLEEFDKKSCEQLHLNDHYRVMRAYEHYKMTGSPFSKEREKFEQKNPYDFSNPPHKSWDILHISLEVPKEQHWEIMEQRAKQMIEQGLVEEVEALLEQGFSGKEKPMQSIGYKETLALIARTDPEITNLESLCERIFINTRRLAKSQKTFLQKVTPKEVFNPLESRASLFTYLSNFLAK